MMQSNTDCVHEKPVYSFEDHCNLSNSIIHIFGYPQDVSNDIRYNINGINKVAMSLYDIIRYSSYLFPMIYIANVLMITVWSARFMHYSFHI